LAQEECGQAVKRDVAARVREGVKAVLEEVFEEEMPGHLGASYRELTPDQERQAQRSVHQKLITPASKIEHLEVP